MIGRKNRYRGREYFNVRHLVSKQIVKQTRRQRERILSLSFSFPLLVRSLNVRSTNVSDCDTVVFTTNSYFSVVATGENRAGKAPRKFVSR